MNLSCHKTVVMLNAVPDIAELLDAVDEIARMRGFSSGMIDDAYINGETLYVHYKYVLNRNIGFIEPIAINFRRLIEEGKDYLFIRVEQEKMRFSNDNHQ